MDSLTIIKEITGLIPDPVKLRSHNLHPHVLSTFKKCLYYSFNLGLMEKNDEKLLEITSILDYLHDELNTGHWSVVSIEARQNFSIASFVKTLLMLNYCQNSSVILKECLKCLDLGLLLGAPLEECSELLSASAKLLRTKINCMNLVKINSSIKRNYVDIDELSMTNFAQMLGEVIKELDKPSIENFHKNYFVPQLPVKLKDCMFHWPASKRWLDLNYLLEVAGDRTVPVEIGTHYADEDWSQKLMTLKDFFKNHYLSDTEAVGYLAQHNLFDQITELKEDIRIPEYCCCSLNYEESCDPEINAWLGPKGTVSPLHQDPKNNILAQVYGTKQLLLFSTEDTKYLYPHEDKMLSNTAQVDPINPDYNKFPNFKSAKMYKCLLEPGEMLFIPMKWWHHVTALEKSFSVSFWWQ